MLYCAIDIETTGLNPKVHDIVEFAAVVDDLRDPKPIEDLPRFQAYLKKDNYIGCPYALSMHSAVFEKIAHPEKLADGERILYVADLPASFSVFLGKAGHPFDEKKEKYLVNIAGKNAAMFDIPFLNEKVKDWQDIQFRHRVIDPTILYFSPDKDDSLPDLKTCLNRAGLPDTVSHTALDDALQVVRLIRAKYSARFVGRTATYCDGPHTGPGCKNCVDIYGRPV